MIRFIRIIRIIHIKDLISIKLYKTLYIIYKKDLISTIGTKLNPM